jgi:hypothetical protein
MPLPNLRGDLDFLFNGEIPPRLPEGEYEVAFVGANKKRMFGSGERMFLWFRIVTLGEWYETELYMTCAVPVTGRDWGPSHKFMQAWMLASGHSPKRRDRMSTTVFRNKLFRAKVRTVTRDARQKLRPPERQYSVIDELLELVAGGEVANLSSSHRASTGDA